MPPRLKKSTTTSTALTTTSAPIADIPVPQLLHPTQLEYIRVTSIQTFRDCPRTWALQYLAPEGTRLESTSEAAKIGTAAHAICEQYLLGIHAGQFDQQAVQAAYEVIPVGERQNIHDYVATLQSVNVTKPLFIEERVRMPIVQGMPAISGQMDFVAEIPEGLLILDHKTNRFYENAEVWRTKLQPMLYAYMARRLWGYPVIKFQIGYVNLGRHVQWDTDPADDVIVERILVEVWQRMQAYAASGQWPLTINNTCQFCQLAQICPEFDAAKKGFRNSLEPLVSGNGAPIPPSLYAQLEHVKIVAQIVDAEAKRLKAEIMKDAILRGGTADYPEATASLYKEETRTANVMSTWNAIATYTAQHPEDQAVILEMIDKIFTAKVGGLDEVGKKLPAFKDILATLITKVQSENTSVKITPKKEALIACS